MLCRLCKQSQVVTLPGTHLFLDKKYQAQYHHCSACGYLFVSPVTWLNEAYKQNTDQADHGRYSRNVNFARHLAATSKPHLRILDFGCGREQLLKKACGSSQTVICYDSYVQDLNHPDLLKQHYDIIVAVEVFEHLMDPLAFLDWALQHTDRLILHTRVLKVDSYPDNPYFARQWGQHIGFLTPQTQAWIQKRFPGMEMWTDNNTLTELKKRQRPKDQPMPKAAKS